MNFIPSGDILKVTCKICEHYEFVNEKHHVCWFKGITMKSPYYNETEIKPLDQFGNMQCDFKEIEVKKVESKVKRTLDDYFEVLKK